MSETTSTTDLTAAADEAAIAKALHLAESAATDLDGLFNEDKSTFTRAKRIMKWLDKGADVKLVASQLSIIRANREFPEAKGFTEEERSIAATLAPSKGGVKVADSTIRAYASAWQAVYDSQLVPNEDNVAGAFKVKSKGRTAGPLKRLIEQVAEAVGEVGQEAASEAFVSGTKAILAGRIEADPAKPRTPKDKDEDSEQSTELPEGVPFSIEVAVHNLRVILAQDWSEAERVILGEALVEGLATLTGEPIEV